MNRRPVEIYLGGLFLAYIGVLFLDCGLVDHGRPGHLIVRIVAPMVELGLAYAASSWLLQRAGRASRPRAWSWGAFLVPAIFGVLYIAQTLTLHLSDNFITVLALENGAEGRLVRGPSFYVAIGVGLAWTLVFAYLAWRTARRRASSAGTERWPRWATLLFLALFAWLAGLQENNGRLEAGYRQAPVASFLQVSTKLYRAHTHYDAGPTEEAIIDASSLSRGPYPFEKTAIYHDKLPFPKSDAAPKKMPNVIVIFTEGLSARLVGAYGGHFPNLTPNIDRLAAHTMRVDNYFNHTAATYRGLQGQLTSGYPSAGGSDDADAWEAKGKAETLSKIRYQTLPLLLRDVGYQSYFFSPHPNSVALNDLLRAMGFDQVFTLETALSHSKEYASRLTSGSLNDRDLFGELIDFLKARSEKGASRPLFVGTYDIGTHAFMKIGPTGKAYGDAGNNVLDRFHNYDLELGRFLDYFFSSPYAKDTILIFTADHATFPEPPFRQVAGENYKPYFVDRVPMLVYDPFHQLPSSYDAHGRTTLALAPTIMQLLGIRDGLNSFMGHTIFSQKKQTFGMAAIGHEFYAIDVNGVYAGPEVPKAYREEFERRKETILLYYRLEHENRVFKAIR